MKQWRKYMDKRKTNGIGLVRSSMIQCSNGEVDAMENERELYNSVYREISEIVGLEATLKIYLRFKGQQVNFPVRLYNPHLIQKNVIKEFDGSNIPELARKYDYSEKTIRRMIRDSLEESDENDAEEENLVLTN
jgi:Mor family transcriptional regulator